MLPQTPTYKRYLTNRQNAFDSEKLKEIQKPNLFNEKTFYPAFIKDMLNAKKEVIIYCPFISKFRSEFFKPTLEKLRKRNIPVFIFTRPIEEHESFMKSEIICALKEYEEHGASITYLEGSIHQKVSIIDQKILWEGSLNILSQRSSREMMRRTSDEDMAKQIISYLELKDNLAKGYKYRYENLYHRLVIDARKNMLSKIRIFLTGFAIPAITWLLFAGFKSVILLLRGAINIMSIVGFVFK